MHHFARLAGSDRAALFGEASARCGLPVAIIEKDFWVCWMLERLWASPFAPHLIFKGGTSLSKCFGLIQRFSEDIDIGLDSALLPLDNDAAEAGLSRTQRNKRVTAQKDAAKSWIETTFLQTFSESIRAELGSEAAANWNFETEYDADGMPQLRWNPPLSQLKRRARQGVDAYLNRGVLLEIGSRAARQPASRHDVSPFVAQQIPQAFTVVAARVCALEVGHTFWEKATILHILNDDASGLEAGETGRPRERLSRHCYDLHCIAHSENGAALARDFDLLADVVAFKRAFFCSSLIKEKQYDDARPGTLRCAPHSALDAYFADDYRQMQRSGMLFGEPPAWDEIRQTLQDIENSINQA